MHRGNLNIHLRKKLICPGRILDAEPNDIINDYDKYYKLYKKHPSVDEDKVDIYKPKAQRKPICKSKAKLTYKLKPKQNSNLKNVLEKYFGNVDDNTIKTLTDDILNVMSIDNDEKYSSNNSNNIVENVSNYGNFSHSNFNQNSHNKQLNQQFNITVNAYGHEDLSHLSQTDWKHIIKKKLDAIPELTKKIYIDEETNRNIYIKSFKDGFGLKYNGNRWIPVSMDKLVTELLETNTDRLYDYIESDDTNISGNLYNSANDIIENLSHDKSTIVKRNKMNIKELLVENSHQVLETSGKIQP
jgi:hypothetical protein